MNRSGSISFEATDRTSLAGTLFEGDGAGPAVLISSAAAVKRRFYRPFAEALLQAGAGAVLTYDYRGVGDSGTPKARPARMKEWGTLDFPAALSALQAAAPGRELVGCGHSFGGLAIGLSNEANCFERYAMVATLNGYWRRTAEPYSVFLRMNAIGVPLTYALGRLPGWIGLGTTLPGQVFRDWARWCRQPEFFFDDPMVPETSRFANVRCPLLSVGIEDDRWGTPPAVAALHPRYANADLHEVWMPPSQTGGHVGHLGFFRRENAKLWPAISRYLLDGTLPPQAMAVSRMFENAARYDGNEKGRSR